MPKRQIAIFFTVFFTLYGLINYYIFIRGYQGLEYRADIRPVYTGIFLFVSLSYIIGRFLEKRYLSLLSDIFIWVGSFWFAFILYFLLGILLLDLSRLINHFVNFLPAYSSFQYVEVKFYTTFIVIGFTVLTIAAGYFNARNIRIRKYDFTIPKRNDVAKVLKLAVASDIHLGTIINRSWTKYIVERINSLDVDLVLLPGDIVDGDVEPVIKQNLGEVLRTIKSKYGIFGITGNHEYIGGVEPAVKYITAHGITELRDQVLEVAGMTIIGREDRSKKGRKGIEELAEGLDKSKPIILMDHQPFHLEEGVSIGADLQLSGHTHHGQLWPLNFITKKVYELSWGYKKIADTHIYVSCGAGLWGPPVRLGNTPEIIEITLRFL